MKTPISVVYADFSDITLDSGRYLTELTWVTESLDYQSLSGHHYFVDYPGAKDSERQLTKIIGGKPLVRYSAPTVLQAFFSQLPPRAIVAFKTRESKERFKEYIGNDSGHYRTMCVYDDVVVDESEAAFINDIIIETKIEAAKKFGNAL